MRNILFLFIFVVFVFINVTLKAQWVQTNGIGNNQVISFLQSGPNLFAGTTGGVFISSDNGSNWTAVNNGITNLQVRELAVSGNNLFASTWGAGVFLSTDNGSNWTAVNNGLTQLSVETLLIDGNNLFAGTLLGVFRSTDNGVNWIEVSTGLPFARHVKYLSKNGDYIFASTIRGVYRTNDNGANWTENNTGLPPTGIASFAMMGDNIFVATVDSSYTGVYVSTDFGVSWTSTNNIGLSNNEIFSLAVSGTNLFAGSSNGLFFSSDSGADWVTFNEGLTALLNNSLYVIDNNLFAGMAALGAWKRELPEVTAVEDFGNNLPLKYKLIQNYPNPFNPSTTIEYQLPNASKVSLIIYDVLGQQIKSLVNREQPAGYYNINVDASSFSSGIYFYRISTGKFVQTKKMILLK